MLNINTSITNDIMDIGQVAIFINVFIIIFFSTTSLMIPTEPLPCSFNEREDEKY